MKNNILKYTLPFLLALGLIVSSCDDLELDNKGAVSADTYYSDANTLEPAVIGIYARVFRATWALEPIISTYGADDLTTHNTGNKGPILEGDQFNRTAGNGWATVLYQGYYDAILQCNSFLAGASKQADVINETVLNNALANAYFIRGMLYFRLATTFKDVPMPLVPEPDVKMGKTPYADVMMQAVKDLQYAEKWLVSQRDVDPTVPDGHATKTAAKAMLAKVYMQLTGYPTNYTTIEIDGVTINLWNQVKALNKEIIDADVYTLMDDYASNFQYVNQINAENIFSHICEKGVWPTQGQSRYYGFKWRDWADCFMENKFAADFPVGYRRSFSVIDVADTTGLNIVREDPSKATAQRAIEIHQKRAALNKREKRVSEYIPSIYSFHHPMVGKFNYATVPGFKGSYTDGTGTKVTYDNTNPEYEHKWQTSNDCPAMRTAEVYLMYAEACVRSGENAEAIKYLNYVRRRAYAQGLLLQADVVNLPVGFWKNDEPAVDYTAAQGDLLENILKERAYEFLGEVGGNYWLDLIRLEKVAEANAYRVNNDVATTGELPIEGDPDDRNEWWCKIPSTEVVLNPNLGE